MEREIPQERKDALRSRGNIFILFVMLLLKSINSEDISNDVISQEKGIIF